MVANEMGYLTLILIPLIGLHLAIAFTRSVEDTGRLDILTAGAVHRLAPSAAGVTAAAVPAALTVAFSTLALVLLGYPGTGSLLYAGGLGMFMVAFTAAGAVAAQCCRDARTAYVLAVGFWLASYLTRAVVDVRGWNVTWVNPESWPAEIQPFSAAPPWWPWFAFLALTASLFGIAALVAARRDQGAGIIAPRPGSATAAPWIRSPLSLLVRLTRGVGAGWIVAAGLFAFAFGYLTQQMSDLTSAAGGQASNVDATLTVFVQMNALLAAAAGLQISQWLAREETSGRIGHILAAPVSRTRWWTSATVLVTGWSLLLLSCAGLFTGLGLTAGFNDWSYLGRGLTATLAYSPAVILFAGIAAALSALSPRMVALAWLAIGWGTIVCLRADLLRIPGWARHLSPLDWMGSVPGDAWDRPAAALMTVLAVALAVTSTLIYRRRDLSAG
ncbi:ABC transporter permease [Amorphoplanes digitatis]